MKIPRSGQVILITVGFLLALWVSLIILVAAASDVYRYVRAWTSDRDFAGLPNVPDDAHARRLHADMARLTMHYVPFVVWRRDPYGSATVNVNAEGLRMHTRGRDNDPDAVSIGFFGGSAMWGTGVDDDETIPAIFDQITRNYDVANYGETGHNSRQNLAQVINLANQNRGPRVVVFYNGHNDVAVSCNLAVAQSLNGHGQEVRLRDQLDEARRRRALYGLLVAPVVQQVRQARRALVSRDRSGSCDRDPLRADAVAETMIRNWEIARTIVTAYGGQFHAFLQPSAYEGRPRVDHLRGYSSHDWFGAQIRTVYTAVRKKLDRRRADWTTDLTGVYDGDEYIYLDAVHVSANGNRRVAERIRDRLAATVKTP